MKTITRSVLLALAAIGFSVRAEATLPTITWLTNPVSINESAVAYPVAQATKGSYNLSSIYEWYSYDNATWTLFEQTTSPNNSNTYYPSGDFLGGCVGFTQTGTLYLKATVTDTAAQAATATTSIAVNTTNAFATILCANADTYNYGPAWLWDSSLGNSRCWWTAGYPGGGDCIDYAAWPLGSTIPSIVLSSNAWGNKLISNPCVIKASYGNGYGYAMYFDGDRSGYPGDIEVAYSNNGTSWTTPTVAVSTQFPSSGSAAGAAMGSVIRFSSSNYVMFYTDASSTGTGNLYMRTSSDGMTWSSSPVAVSQTGLTNFGNNLGLGLGNCPSIAYRASDGCYYMAYTEVPANTVMDIYKIAIGSVTTGTWTNVYSLGTSQTMYYKSNPGILRDENGYIPSGFNVYAAYATSVYNASVGFDNIFTSQIYYTYIQ